MAILRAGTSRVEFPQGGVETTAANLSPHCAEGVRFTAAAGSNTPAEAWSGAGQSEIWFSGYVRFGGTFGSTEQFLSFPAIGGETINLTASSLSMAPTIRVRRASTFLGSSTLQVAVSTLYRIDAHLVKSATTGRFRLWFNSVLYIDFTGDTGAQPTTSVQIFRHSGSGGATDWSGIVVADEDTRGMEYVQAPLVAEGALSEWVGDIGDVSDTGFDDNTFYLSSTPDQRQTFAKGALPSQFQNGFNVRAVCVSARARAENGALRPMVLSGSDEGFGTETNLLGAFEARQHIFTTDPGTGADWTVAGADAAEIGVQSRPFVP